VPTEDDVLVRLLGGKPFVYSCAIENENYLLPLSIKTTDALGDTGANGYIFISTKFTKRLIYQLHLIKATGFVTRTVRGYDGGSRQ